MKTASLILLAVAVPAIAGCVRPHVSSWSEAAERKDSCAGTEWAKAAKSKAPSVAAAGFVKKNLVDYRPTTLVDSGEPKLARRAEVVGGRSYLAVVSYPGIDDPFLIGRSFVYDDALALIWFSWIGDERSARGLKNTLTLLQNPDGSFGFSFSTGRDGYYNARYVRTGTVAWAAYALEYFGRKYGDGEARAGAQKASGYLDSLRNDSGLINGGSGSWSWDYKFFDPAFRFDVSVAEHQFDSHMAQSYIRGGSTENGLAGSIVSRLWMDGEGRFGAAFSSFGVDKGRALDAAGAWGGLWLLMNGMKEMAARSFDFTSRYFYSTDGVLTGYRPYLDPVDGELPPMHESMIFMEGSLGMGLLANRLGNAKTASDVLSTASMLICLTGSGVPYSSREARGFPANPSLSATLWYLFLEREYSGGSKAPLFSMPVVDAERSS